MNKVTAVLPTIGRLQYLDIAIESILNQSKSFDEIIVFDNSKEQNIKDLSKFSTNKKVNFIRSGNQLSANESWNSAVQNAACEYVTIVGDDDVLLPNYCEHIHTMIKISDVGILKAHCIDENGVKKNKLVYPEKNILTYKELIFLRFFNKISLFVPGIFFKKELFLKIGGFKNTYFDGLAYSDELLLSELSVLACKITISKEFCWSYRVHSGQIGGVPDISNYVNKVISYLELYETSLESIGISMREFYPKFTKQDYMDKVCGNGAKLYGVFSGKNKNMFIFLSDLNKYFIFDKRVSRKSRLINTLLSIKAFIGATRLGTDIKRVWNK